MAAGPVLAFGELLRRYRVAAGLSQETLADRAGLSAWAISDVELLCRRSSRTGALRTRLTVSRVVAITAGGAGL